MAARPQKPEKRPGFFSQLKTLYKFTSEEFSFLPWVVAGVVVLGVGVGVGIGLLLPGRWWNVLLWGITGLLFGILGAMITMTRMSTVAMYRKIDGMPGATGHVMSSMLGRRWASSDMPVGVNPKTQDAVYRAIGRGGVVIVGEGARGRLTRLVNDERVKISRVANGVPVHILYVGHGEGDVPIKDLSKTVKKYPKALNRATMGAVIKRVDSVSQSVTSLPIPKGVDPMRVRPQRPR